MNIDGERSEVAELFCTAESPVEDDWCLVETGGHGVDHMIQVGRTASQVAQGMVTGSACALANTYTDSVNHAIEECADSVRTSVTDMLVGCLVGAAPVVWFFPSTSAHTGMPYGEEARVKAKKARVMRDHPDSVWI